jgi:hypothetical protein
VAVLPPEVTTVAEESESGMVVVVVPPLEVRTWLTVGLEARVTDSVPPYGVTTWTVDGVGDGANEMELTNSELGRV